MKCIRTLLADTAEALLHWFNFQPAADRLWMEACIAEEKLVESEAEEEVWSPHQDTCEYCNPQTSPAARTASAGTAAGESPAAPSTSASDVAAAGHPTFDWRDYLDAARAVRKFGETKPAYFQKMWIDLAERLEIAATEVAK